MFEMLEHLLLWVPWLLLYGAIAGVLRYIAYRKQKQLEALLEAKMGSAWLDGQGDSPQEMLRDSIRILHSDPQLRKIHRQFAWWSIGVGIIVEELISRGPLVLLFDSFTTSAWIGYGVSSALFALIHARNGIAVLWSRMTADSFEHVVPWRVRLGNIIWPGILGAILGYVAIKYQTMAAPIAIHMLWNAVMPRLVGRTIQWINKKRVPSKMGSSI